MTGRRKELEGTQQACLSIQGMRHRCRPGLSCFRLRRSSRCRRCCRRCHSLREGRLVVVGVVVVVGCDFKAGQDRWQPSCLSRR